MSSARFRRFWSILSKFASLGPKSANLGQIQASSTKLAQVGPNYNKIVTQLGQLAPKSSRLGPTSVKLSPTRAKFGQDIVFNIFPNRPNLLKHEPDSATCLLTSSKRPTLGKHRSGLTRAGRTPVFRYVGRYLLRHLQVFDVRLFRKSSCFGVDVPLVG